ncbi:MAG: hypothetical protein AAF926_00315 [Pseudomonadota bacterium]
MTVTDYYIVIWDHDAPDNAVAFDTEAEAHEHVRDWVSPSYPLREVLHRYDSKTDNITNEFLPKLTADDHAANRADAWRDERKYEVA